jgi:exosortase B
MYGPTLYDLLKTDGLWTRPDYGHGPLILGISLFLLWRRWGAATDGLPPGTHAAAWPIFAIGALLYLSGRWFDAIVAEVGSLIWMIAGCVALLGGYRLLKALAFPLLFMLFAIPLPGFLLGPINDVMKVGVSAVAEPMLSAMGYAVARTGVIIQVEQYHLLVAEACAGMRTLLMLEALGILYLNLVRHASILRNVTLAILIVPISFAANVIRVVVLALVTVHFGDEAGQGFMHDFAGFALFMAGLALTVLADTALRAMSRVWNRLRGRAA